MPPKASAKSAPEKPGSPSAAPLVLVTGDDDFAVKARAKQIFSQWTADAGGFDHETIDAAASNSGEALNALNRLREALQTLPFFGGAKAILFQNCNFLGEERAASSAAVTEALANLSDELKRFDWQGVKLLITSPKVDKRKTFYKTLDKLGTVETFSGWSIEDKDWMDQAEMAARRQLRDLGKEIDDRALGALVTNVGPNNRALASEVEKLALYVGDRTEIVRMDVEAIVSRNKQAKGFALADAVGNRDLPRVLKNLDLELWSLQTDSQKSEIGLLYSLISKVRMMLFLKEMIKEGWIRAEMEYGSLKAALEKIPPGALPSDRRFNPLAMHPFMLYNALGQSKNYSSEELVKAMEILLEANRSLVSSSADEAMVLQHALVRIVQSGTRA